MKTLMEELGGCLILIVLGRVMLNVMQMFYSLAETL